MNHESFNDPNITAEWSEDDESSLNLLALQEHFEAAERAIGGAALFGAAEDVDG